MSSVRGVRISRVTIWLLPVVLPVVAAAVVAVGVGAWRFATSGPTLATLCGLIALLVAATIAEAFPVPIEGSSTSAASLAAVFIVAAAALYGWAPATLVAAFAMAVVQFVRGQVLTKAAYNVSIYAVAGAEAGLVAGSLRDGEHLWSLVVAALVASAAFWLADVALLATVIARATPESPFPVIRYHLRRTALPFAIMASLTAAVVALWQRSPFLTVVLLGPLLAVALYQRAVRSVLTRLRELDRLKEEFITVVSHELRTPLASVYGAATTLRQRQLDDGTRAQLLTIIYEESDRLARLLDEVTLTNSLEADGRIDTPTTACDVVEIVRESTASLRAQQSLSRSEAHPLEVVCKTLSAPVVADPGKLRRVMTNLLENAVKYSPPGGRIETRVESSDGHLRVSVADEGVGILPDDRERVFEKFYRVDPHLTRGVSGTGLGLYICRRLVEEMNGRIWVASEPGQGSTFTFELPLADAN